jgi:hypothetical protein
MEIIRRLGLEPDLGDDGQTDGDAGNHVGHEPVETVLGQPSHYGHTLLRLAEKEWVLGEGEGEGEGEEEEGEGEGEEGKDQEEEGEEEEEDFELPSCFRPNRPTPYTKVRTLVRSELEEPLSDPLRKVVSHFLFKFSNDFLMRAY